MSTKLGTLINRMDRYATVQRVDSMYKIQDLDEAIRETRRRYRFPWALTASTLKVFPDIISYDVSSDFDGLAFLDDKGKFGVSKPQFQYTSVKQFYEDPNNKNLIAEIWDDGQCSLGVKYKDLGASQIILDDCSAVANYTPSGTFTSVENETVQTAIGSNSVKAIATDGNGIITCDFSDVIDTEYKKKFFFVYLYFSAIPSSVDIKLKKDDSNYLSKNILTQFDGNLFKANSWNVLAFDLNDCVVEGATGGEFTSYELTLNGVETGNYFIGESYLKGYVNLNYQYYTSGLIETTAGVKKTQFLNEETNEYDLLDVLIGDDVYSDIILFEALTTAINEQENKAIYDKVEEKRLDAWSNLFERYPDMQNNIVTDYYNFVDNSDINQDNSTLYV